MDFLTKEERSERMRRIRSKNTKPELFVRSLLHRHGYRFRIHRKDLPGSPDIVFPAKKKVIFVHGCFWHFHQRCRTAKRPKSRQAYWDNKFLLNKRRDKRHAASLKRQGWQVLTVWECQTRDEEYLLSKLKSFLGP